MKCHTFSEPQAQTDLNDDDEEDDNNTHNNDHINEDNKEEDDDNEKLSSVIPFRNHKLNLI